jgi:hypothetical protein
MTAEVTSVATERRSSAIAAPKDFSPPTDRQRQLAFGRKGLVVDRILREGRELIERRPHRAGSRVKSGVVAARGFVDRPRIGRQLVPEAIEIDALPAFDQPLDVRAAEIEMPPPGAADDLVPGPDAGKRASMTTQRVTRSGYCAANA